MNDTLREHYRKLLGLERPWNVTEIDLDVKRRRVDIRLVHEKGHKVTWLAD